MTPVHTPHILLIEIKFDTILPSAPWSLKWPYSLNFLISNSVYISISCACHIRRPSHSRCKLYIMKLNHTTSVSRHQALTTACRAITVSRVNHISMHGLADQATTNSRHCRFSVHSRTVKSLGTKVLNSFCTAQRSSSTVLEVTLLQEITPRLHYIDKWYLWQESLFVPQT
jgi:hypothetical protein